MELNHSGKAHKGQGQNAGHHQGDGGALHALGNVHQVELFANTGKGNQGQAKSYGRGHGKDYCFHNVEILTYGHDGYSQNGTVGGDQGQKHTQGLVEWGTHLFKHNFDQLYQGSNDQNKRNGLQVGDGKWNEDIVLDEPGNDGSNNHYKGHCAGHSNTGRNSFGNTQKGADSQKLGQYYVVDKDGRYDDEKIGHGIHLFLLILLESDSGFFKAVDDGN